jgi:hypothetical protein
LSRRFKVSAKVEESFVQEDIRYPGNPSSDVTVSDRAVLDGTVSDRIVSDEAAIDGGEHATPIVRSHNNTIRRIDPLI